LGGACLRIQSLELVRDLVDAAQNRAAEGTLLLEAAQDALLQGRREAY